MCADILITGAAGKTGRAIIKALVGRGVTVRALVRRAEQGHAAQELGAQEAIFGDMRDAAAWQSACAGVRALYHICPNVSPDEMMIGQTAIAAAQAAGVERFVYHSVLHPQVEAMPHHWLKLRVEEFLFASGLAYTILQPAAYMQNVLAQWERITTQGVYPVPYPASTRLGMVDLADVAEAAALVLTEAGHAGSIYELAGPEALTQTEVAAILGQQLGHPVRVEVVPLDTWEASARAAGLGEYQVATLLAMFRYYEQHGFWGNPHVLSWLLGRPARKFGEFIERILGIED